MKDILQSLKEDLTFRFQKVADDNLRASREATTKADRNLYEGRAEACSGVALVIASEIEKRQAALAHSERAL